MAGRRWVANRSTRDATQPSAPSHLLVLKRQTEQWPLLFLLRSANPPPRAPLPIESCMQYILCRGDGGSLSPTVHALRPRIITKRLSGCWHRRQTAKGRGARHKQREPAWFRGFVDLARSASLRRSARPTDVPHRRCGGPSVPQRVTVGRSASADGRPSMKEDVGPRSHQIGGPGRCGHKSGGDLRGSGPPAPTSPSSGMGCFAACTDPDK